MNVIWDMTIGEIGQIVALTVAIAISLYIGVKSIRQTRYLQARHENLRQQDNKQKLLNEIIDWATGIFECGRVPDTVQT
jgi:hypothetical protein